MFTQLCDAVGPDELLKIVTHGLNSDPSGNTQTILREAALESLLQNPPMMDALFHSTALLKEKPELAIALIERAFHHANTETLRRQIKALAFKFRLDGFLKKKKPVDLKQFTASQAKAFQRLRVMSSIYFGGAEHRGVKLRTTSLLVGPSGVGKTHVANALAESLGLPLLRLTVGDWLVSGSRPEPTTLQTLQKFIGEHSRCIVFLDELDKFRSQDNTWSQAAITEVFSMLDRQVNYRGTKDDPWTQGHTLRMQTGVFIIAAGTWQDIWKKTNVRAMGFSPEAVGSFDETQFVRKVREAGVIPEELLNRFNDEWLLLQPYGAADYESIGRQLGLDHATLNPDAAMQSGLNFRYVERVMTNAAIKRATESEKANEF